MIYEFFELISDAVGIMGVVLTLIAYFLINMNKVKSDNFGYIWLNLIGSLELLFSLYFHWNLASTLIEVAWAGISLIALYRALKAKKLAVEQA